MRIGINALYLLPGKVGGTETYLRALFHALQKLDTAAHEFIIYTNRENAGTFTLTAPNFRESALPVRAESRAARIVFEQTVLPVYARRDRLDVLHSPGNTAPLVAFCPNVTTLHDIGYHSFPTDWSTVGLIANKLLIPPMNRRAAGVITISRASKEEIVRVLGIAPERVRVVYHGVDGNVAHATEIEQRRVQTRFGLDGEFLLSVSGTHPHKNLDGLLRTYAQFAARRENPPPLVVVGVRGTHQARIEQLAKETRGRVVLTGWISDMELGALYRTARLLVFVSLYEGFGFPPLEAMSVDLPVVCSNTTSLPEVVGDAGLLVDPRDEESVVVALERAWSDESLRHELMTRGRAQAALFTWQKAASETLAVLHAAARG